jgi:hypothetical protein
MVLVGKSIYRARLTRDLLSYIAVSGRGVPLTVLTPHMIMDFCKGGTSIYRRGNAPVKPYRFNIARPARAAWRYRKDAAGSECDLD